MWFLVIIINDITAVAATFSPVKNFLLSSEISVEEKENEKLQLPKRSVSRLINIPKNYLCT